MKIFVVSVMNTKKNKKQNKTLFWSNYQKTIFYFNLLRCLSTRKVILPQATLQAMEMQCTCIHSHFALFWLLFSIISSIFTWPQVKSIGPFTTWQLLSLSQWSEKKFLSYEHGIAFSRIRYFRVSNHITTEF